MNKILLTLFMMFCASLTYAQAYWCPENIVCGGVDVVTCQKGNFSDIWRLDDQRYSNILDPYFHHVGAIYDANTGIGKCTYRNNNSQGLGLVSILGSMKPFFEEGPNWKWSDPTKSWASCIGHSECPFKS